MSVLPLDSHDDRIVALCLDKVLATGLLDQAARRAAVPSRGRCHQGANWKLVLKPSYPGPAEVVLRGFLGPGKPARLDHLPGP